MKLQYSFQEASMNLIKRFLFSGIVLWVLFPSLFAAETILVPANSYLLKFGKEKDDWGIKAKVQQDFLGEVIRKKEVFMQPGKTIGFYTDAYELKIPGTEGLCYLPDVSFTKDKDGKFMPKAGKIDFLMFLGIFIFLTGLAVLGVYFHRKSEKDQYLLPAALLLFYFGYAFWYLGYVSNAFIPPTDGVFYFKIAEQLSDFDFTSSQYRYPIGFPILCIPFILLFHLQHLQEFVLVYMNFQTFVLIPGVFLVLYSFFRKKMGFTSIQGFCVLLLWLILSIFYLPMCSETNPAVQYIPENYDSNAHFSLVEDNIYSAFVQMTSLGRNTMSDYMALFLSIILLYIAMKKSRSLLRFTVISMGFGFLCLVRLNYIFFAPLLAFILYDSFSDLWKYKRNYLYAVLCGTAGFMLVFIWQFIINKIQFGSPFIWPYSLHPYAPDRGFVWRVVPYGYKFLVQSNYIYFVLGISSLLFIRERLTRVLLTLWIFPMFLFFTGYPIVFNNPTRFIFMLYPPLAAAIVLNPVWKAVWSVRIKAAMIVLSACLLCKSNIFFAHFQPWNLNVFGISNHVFIMIQSAVFLFCCIVIISMYKEIRTDHEGTFRHFCFLILFTAVFFSGSVWPYAVGIPVLAALVYGLRDTWGAVLHIMKNR